VIELTGHKGLVVALAYSPDGRTLASASADGTARLWDLATGKLMATLQSPAARAYCVAFSSDGKLVAVGYGGPHGLVQVWDVEPFKRRESWIAHLRVTRGVVFTGGDAPNIRQWAFGESFQGVNGFDLRAPGNEPVGAVAYSADGRYIAALTHRPAAIRVWDDRLQPYRRTKQLSNWGHSIVFHPDGDRIAVGLDRTIALWKPAGYSRPTTWPAHDGAVLGVAFTPDGQTLLTGAADGLVKLWDPAGRLRHTFDWNVGDVGAVAFAPDGLTAAAGGNETILVWDVSE
jgi:WD40 repeat protein